MKIPFRYLPSSWGLKGKTRQRAEAEYMLKGYELEIKLAEIDLEDAQALELKKLDISLKHGKIDAYAHAHAVAAIKFQDTELEIEKLAVDLAHHRISQNAHDKALADIKKEPWVAMPDINWDPTDPSRSYFELDYNDHFVNFLIANKYMGATSDEVVEKWLTEVCRSVAAEMAMDDPAFVSSAVTTKKVRKPKKKTEYS